MTNRPGAWLLFILVSMTPVLPADVGAAEAATGSRYDRTLRALHTAEPEWRADFAGIALWQLVGAYQAEADLAREDIQRRDEHQPAARVLQKNRHWSSSVDQYASRLAAFQRRVEDGAPVSFVLSSVTEAVLQVGDEQVMLAHPRPGQQAAFEQSVLEQFCQLRDCGALTGLARFADNPQDMLADGVIAVAGGEPGKGEARRPAAHASPKPGWEFTAEGSACSYDGIRINFERGDNPGAVRKLCLELFAEIAALRDGLLQQQQYGVRVDWAALHFSPLTVEGDQPMLTLNRTGDLLRLHSPLLRGHPALLGSLKPWLEAHLGGGTATLDLQAATYGWRGTTLER